jgi:hypothetical protein
VHWDGTSWSIVPSPNPNLMSPIQGSQLEGIAAISAIDIWAVGFNEGSTLTEHWDGKSWKVVNSPNPGQSNFLAGVTALSDGTVVAVGNQFSSTTGTIPLILQNPVSAPKAGTRSAALDAPAATAGLTSVALVAPATAAGSTVVAPTTTIPARSPDDAPVDQIFVAVAKADQPLSLAGHRIGEHEAAANGDLDGLAADRWLWDGA